MPITPVQKFIVGAGSATLATAVSNYNTAIATAVTTAQAVVGVIGTQITIVPNGLIYDGTLYVVSGSVLYKVST